MGCLTMKKPVWKFRIHEHQARDAHRALDLASGRLVRINGKLFVYATADTKVAAKIAKILRSNPVMLS